VFFALHATREALTKQRWFLAGVWLACAGFARPTALFLTPFFLIIMFYATRHTRRHIAFDVLRNAALFGVALVIGIGAHFIYNYARFRSLTDFGYAYVAGADNITSVYARYGGFNPRFVPCNLGVSLLSPPEVNGVVPSFISQACAYLLEGVKLSDASAPITPNPLGMSVFFVTPALLIIVAPLGGFQTVFQAHAAPLTPPHVVRPRTDRYRRVDWPADNADPCGCITTPDRCSSAGVTSSMPRPCGSFCWLPACKERRGPSGA
jgi:hypothetical protein